MKKFLVLYKAPLEAFQKAMKAAPEEQKKMMETWGAWMQKAGPSLVDMGGPLGKTMQVKKGSTAPITNDLGGYSIIQGESKEAVAETLKDHPHFMMGDGGTIEVCELMPMPTP